jgi:hypothetical protein
MQTLGVVAQAVLVDTVQITHPLPQLQVLKHRVVVAL